MSIAALDGDLPEARIDEAPPRNDLLGKPVVDDGRLTRDEIEQDVFGTGIEPDLLIHLSAPCSEAGTAPNATGKCLPRQSQE